MFMFRRKRTYLLKRLWKARVKPKNEIRSEEEILVEDEDETSRSCTGSWCSSGEGLLRNSVLKRLKDNQLELLLEAVDSGGAGPSACVLVPKDIIQEPHVLCCQIWRWFSLRSSDELRRTPACSCASDPVYICCNPYHWSRLCEPESPPPPYSRFNSDKMNSDDCISNEKILEGYHLEYHHHIHHHPFTNPFYQEDVFRGSLSTNGESDTKETEWCKLAYWELSQRVGRLYPVQNSAVNIFWTDIQADGLSLETLTHHTFSTHESVIKNRNKIGLGITLSLEDDGVWIYNRSNWPVFVNSPSLDRPGCRTFLVYRVPAGHCSRVFYSGARTALSTYWNGPPIGPVDPNSVRISFAKGWGPKYRRQEITGCPTWLEILLSPCELPAAIHGGCSSTMVSCLVTVGLVTLCSHKLFLKGDICKC